MSLFSLSEIKNRPRRSSFDLGQKNAFTSKIGELLPVYSTFVLPGDKFEISQDWFTRTQPVDTSAFTRLREYYDWYFVPLHLLYRNAPEIIMQLQNQPNYASSPTANIQFSTQLPHISNVYPFEISEVLRGKKNALGFDRGYGIKKIAEYLGYGEQSNDYKSKYNTSTFFAQAYQKIYYDVYRNSQWEKNQPYLYNCDYYNGSGPLALPASLQDFGGEAATVQSIFELRYCNWNKDLFFGALPSSQFGDVAQVSTVSDGTVSPFQVVVNGKDNSAGRPDFRVLRALGTHEALPTADLRIGYTPDMYSSPFKVNDEAPLFARSAAASGTFSVLQLRAAEALQRWKEIAIANGQNYKDQVKAHFGVTAPAHTSHRCRYVGGFNGTVDISAVENTNLSSDDAIIRGKGIGSQTTDKLYFDNTDGEYGVLMCIYHALPLLDYVLSGPSLQLATTVDGTSFPIPELDSLGLEPLPSFSILNSKQIGASVAPEYILGYVPRYISWKTNVDVVNGAFKSALKSWVAPISKDYLSKYLKGPEAAGQTKLGFNWFKANPSVLDPIFGVVADSTVDSDQLLNNSQFNVTVARNLSYDGMPY